MTYEPYFKLKVDCRKNGGKNRHAYLVSYIYRLDPNYSISIYISTEKHGIILLFKTIENYKKYFLFFEIFPQKEGSTEVLLNL